MAKKTKKKTNTPRAKRMNRQGRLQSAVRWFKTYNGKRLIRGYGKHYGVDVGTAIVELQLLGVPLSEETIRKARAGAAASVKAKQARKEKRMLHLQEEEFSGPIDSDETYAYIAGYTDGGVPYGNTWEEMERIADRESLDQSVPPRTHLPYCTSEDEKDRPYVEDEKREELPFDIEEFIRCHTGRSI